MSTVNNNTPNYSNVMNQQRLANSASLLGGSNMTSGASIIPGISGDMLSQWAMLGANSKAFRALQTAQKKGTLRQDNVYHELQSDRLLNDNYDPKTKKIKKATYTPIAKTTPEIDKEATHGDVLTDMRTLALSAISNPNSLNSTHYDFFEKMRSSIESNLVTKKSTSSTEVTKEAAQPAEITKEVDYRLLLDDQSFTVAGKDAEVSYNFGVGTSLEDVVAGINADSKTHGVQAELVETEDGAIEIKLNSLKEGANELIRVDQTQGDLFTAAGNSISAKGKDEVKGKGEEVATSDKTQAALAAGIAYGKVFEDTEFVIQGRDGSKTFSFENGATAEEIVTAINDATSKTGVRAEVIYGADGAEGIGLLAEKPGSGNYIHVNQIKGDLFARTGQSTSVAGSSTNSDDDVPPINNVNDLGRVSINGETYSFADLVQGGRASLAKNPDAALAVLDQTIKDIYDGRAVIEGFDPADVYIPGVTVNNGGSKATTNAYAYNDMGSSAIEAFINRYAPKSSGS
ncbi:MAG: hypothetical protein LUE17_13360 [Planctomycetaceae bacterium]|nr:hypothetical protein [Planctomycetaceae bacterium]